MKKSWPSPCWPWVGGKRHLVDLVLEQIPSRPIRTFYSPFVGAGAVELAVLHLWRGKIGRVQLGDVNPRLVRQWDHVLLHPWLVAQDLEALETRADFYLTRQELNDSAPGELRAHFIWCGARAFSGLYRVNRQGEFNAAEDKDKKRPLPTLARLEAVSELLASHGAAVQCLDWADLVKYPGEGDVVFLDPPYLDTYSGYSAGRWSRADWQMLLSRIARWVDDGARVILCERAAVLPDIEAMDLPMRVARKTKRTCVNGAVKGGMEEIVVTLSLDLAEDSGRARD